MMMTSRLCATLALCFLITAAANFEEDEIVFSSQNAAVRHLSPSTRALIAKELEAAKTCISDRHGRCIKEVSEAELGEHVGATAKIRKGKASSFVSKGFICSSSTDHMKHWITSSADTTSPTVSLVTAGTSVDTASVEAVSLNRLTMTASSGVVAAQQAQTQAHKGKKRLGETGKPPPPPPPPPLIHSAAEYITSDQKMCRVTTARGTMAMTGKWPFPYDPEELSQTLLSHVTNLNVPCHKP